MVTGWLFDHVIMVLLLNYLWYILNVYAFHFHSFHVKAWKHFCRRRIFPSSSWAIRISRFGVFCLCFSIGHNNTDSQNPLEWPNICSLLLLSFYISFHFYRLNYVNAMQTGRNIRDILKLDSKIAIFVRFGKTWISNNIHLRFSSIYWNLISNLMA